MNFNIRYIATASGKYSKKTCEITRYSYHFYSLIWYQMNTTNTPKLLAQELSAEELKLQNAEETRNYKNKKEELNIKDRLDLWNTHLYGKQVGDTLNATNSIASNARVTKAQTQRDLLAILLKKPLNEEEDYAQAA